jgi:ketosteroid isomerase-like protein
MEHMTSALLLILAVSAAAPSGVRAPHAGVQQAFERFIVAFNNLDWDTFHSALSDDVTVFNPDIPEAPTVARIDGRASVEASFRAVFDASRKGSAGPPYLHISPRRVNIQMLGPSAAVVTFEFDRDGGSIGRRTIVFAEDATAWKIVHIHASNIAPAGTGPVQR